MNLRMDPKLEEALRSLEREFRRVVEYVDKEVVPVARQETHAVLRHMARTLDHLADRMEKKGPDEEPK